jgi:23S rRNA pseudouridine2457 synthase
LNKPLQVLFQFTPQDGRQPLDDYIATPNICPADRLDADSEGLMLLTDDKEGT